MVVTPTEQAPQESRPKVDPARRKRSVIVLASVAVAVVLLDQLTKAWVISSIKPRLGSGEGPIVMLGGLLKFTYVENTGASFSIGAGYTWVFSIIAVVVVIVIIKTAGRLGSMWWAVALGGLLGGSIGNLIDRLSRPPGPGRGYVVDFIQLPNFAVFNVADMAITGSAVLMVVLALKGVDFTTGKSR